MGYKERLIKQIPCLTKYIASIRTEKLIRFHFADKYDCEEDDIFYETREIHKQFIELIKQEIINKGFKIIKYDYKEDYINYADCYRSSCTYYIE